MTKLEQLKEYDYEYLLIRSTLEDIEDNYTRDLVLDHFDRLIKRLIQKG